VNDFPISYGVVWTQDRNCHVHNKSKELSNSPPSIAIIALFVLNEERMLGLSGF
jgi:hypothetical protein